MTPADRTDQPGGANPDDGRVGATRGWAPALVIVAVVLVLALIVVLHLTGAIGRGTH